MGKPTSSLRFAHGKKVDVSLYSYVPPQVEPPIPSLSAHTQVEWMADWGPTSSTTVDWVQVSVWVRRGPTVNGTWMTNAEVLVDGNTSPHRWLMGKPRLIAMLHHEQGHYDITALLARDLFNDVKALIEPKPTVFKTAQELVNTLQNFHSDTQALEATLRGNYDIPPGYDGLYAEETKRGTDMRKQEEWNAILRMAWNGRPLREVLKIMKKKI